MNSLELLKATSRAFYLSLRVLPSGSRQTMSLAYLLARCADSLSDGAWLAPQERLPALQEFLGLMQGQRPNLEAWKTRVACVDPQSGSEAALLHHLPQALAELQNLPAADQLLIREIVATLAQGMIVDLERFPGCVLDEEELRRHLWSAAGCVGGFWSSVLRLHEPRLRRVSLRLEELGTQLGNGLQLTNVLRDVSGDLAEGRCYLPLNQLTRLGLDPEALRDSANESRLKPLYLEWLESNLDYYQASMDYVLLLPPACWRLRLAALWPWLLGVATAHKLTRGNWLKPGKIKVKRAAVYFMMAKSLLLVAVTPWLRQWMSGELESARKALRQARG